MIAHALVGPLLQIFFTDHLVAQRRLSLQTVASYRDTFRLLLQFVHRETGIEPVALKIPGLDAEIILRFLDALEKDRGNTVVSRNLRLTRRRRTLMSRDSCPLSNHFGCCSMRSSLTTLPVSSFPTPLAGHSTSTI